LNQSSLTLAFINILLLLPVLPLFSALLGYSKELQYGDSRVETQSWTAWAKNWAVNAAVGAATYAPSIFGGFLPKAGEGPLREDMEKGFLKLHATATMVDSLSSGDPETSPQQRRLVGLFSFQKDTAYLYTAALLCETGLLLLEKYGSLPGGCQTPASALGGELTERILKNMDTSLEIKEVKEDEGSSE